MKKTLKIRLALVLCLLLVLACLTGCVSKRPSYGEAGNVPTINGNEVSAPDGEATEQTEDSEITVQTTEPGATAPAASSEAAPSGNTPGNNSSEPIPPTPGSMP